MNRIIIKPLEQGFNPQSYLLNEDFNIEARSEYSSFGELLPSGSGDIINYLTASNAAAGQASTGLLYIHSVIDMKRWTRTNPITINITLKFYTSSNVIDDVWYPTNLFLSLSVLSRKVENNINLFSTPGPNLGSLKTISDTLKGTNSNLLIKGSIKETSFSTTEALNNSQQKIFPQEVKLISCLIPGVIYLPIAFVENAVPTYSNKIVLTDDGMEFPLWSTLQLQITGITPAMDEMLTDSTKIQIKDNTVNLIGQATGQQGTLNQVNALQKNLEKEAAIQSDPKPRGGK